MTKKAIVFDLDGTIIDTMGDIAAAVNRALAFYGYPSRTVEEVKSFIGNGSLMLMRRALPNGGSDELCMKLRERFRIEYEADMYSNSSAYEGIKELLDTLSARGLKIAVVTNKDDKCAVPMIRHYFGDVVDLCRGVRADGDRKPNPRVTLEVLDMLGVTPDEILFVGDGMADIEVCRNGGFEIIPVGYGYTHPDRILAETGKNPAMTVSELKARILERL